MALSTAGTAAATGAAAAATEATPVKTEATAKKGKTKEEAAERPGKKEKIRFGQAPHSTLPAAANPSNTENAGAVPEETATAQEPANPLEPVKVQQKSRYSARAKLEKKAKPNAADLETIPGANAPDAAEVADRQVQSAPLGLNGDTGKKKKKKEANTTGEKTRLSDRDKKKDEPAQPEGSETTPGAGAAAPASEPQK